MIVGDIFTVIAAVLTLCCGYSTELGISKWAGAEGEEEGGGTRVAYGRKDEDGDGVCVCGRGK